MKLCRFQNQIGESRIGCILENGIVRELAEASLSKLLESENPSEALERISDAGTSMRSADVRLQAPIERQEVWAAGVTYLRSKKARMDESQFSATAYDRVYDAERPELFFKSMPEKVVGPEQTVGIRRDSKWSVPEPELALVLNSHGKVTGYTIGNDMSSRDIEGENLLYLPQAKIYQGSYALGPCIRIGASEEEARSWTIRVEILRQEKPMFAGETSVSQIKRRFDELAGFLFRSQKFPNGAILLTGTGLVPPDHFTLQEGDLVEIEITGIGKLRNEVKIV